MILPCGFIILERETLSTIYYNLYVPINSLVLDVAWIRKLLHVYPRFLNGLIQQYVHQSAINQVLQVQKPKIEVSLLEEAILRAWAPIPENRNERICVKTRLKPLKRIPVPKTSSN